MPDIRFGVQWAPLIPGNELAGFCRELESLGYFSIGFPDHFFFGRKDPSAVVEPFSAMGFAAASTETLRLVSIVACNDFRHPALFARSIASLDVLSGGRIEAGIGAGWYVPEYEATGIPFDRPSVRIARLEEAIEITKRLWTTDSVDFQGEHYQVDSLPGVPKPVQEPHPPLLIGAGGPKMLALAGRHADVVGITTSVRDLSDRDAMRAEMRPGTVADKIRMIREAASEAGRNPDDLVIQTQIDTIDFDGDDPGHLWGIAGDPSRMIDTIHERAEMGITYFMFRERNWELLRRFGQEVISKL